jgi:exopolyphosphatase/pppGpp-phosphohydrolase
MLDAILAVAGVSSARVCRAALREGLVLEHVGRVGAAGARARRRRGVKLAA